MRTAGGALLSVHCQEKEIEEVSFRFLAQLLPRRVHEYAKKGRGRLFPSCGSAASPVVFRKQATFLEVRCSLEVPCSSTAKDKGQLIGLSDMRHDILRHPSLQDILGRPKELRNRSPASRLSPI